MADQRVIGNLKRLAEICRDGQQGYLEAAEHIGDSQLRAFFNEESLERARYALELKGELARMGEPGAGETAAAAPPPHGWMDLTETVTGDDDVLAAVEQGEDAAKHVYEEVLREKLPEMVEGTVRSQAQGVIAAHDHMKLLREKRQAA
jgi:uncharacterized protein (TIGR02284 family)